MVLTATAAKLRLGPLKVKMLTRLLLYAHTFIVAVMQLASKAPIIKKYNSFAYNDTKHALILKLATLWMPQNRVVPGLGGTVYELFTKSPRYKSDPCTNQRGVDCFVLAYEHGKMYQRIRLTLLSALDCQVNDPTLHLDTKISTDAFGRVDRERNSIVRGANNCKWFC